MATHESFVEASEVHSVHAVEGERQSVFTRLSKPNFDDRLQIPDGLVSKLDFATVVGDKVSTSLQFFPLKDKTQSRVSIPIELAQKVAKNYHSMLYGYFLGPRLPFAIIQKFVKSVWGKFGFVDMMMNPNGFYFFKFNDIGGCNQVIEAGPVMIRGIPLFVFPWDPTKGLTKPTHCTCPLWVKLHNIPLVAFNLEGISRIASALGVPKQVDACTASMCDKAWGRPGFAKVLIDTWSVGELKRELEVVIPSLTGEKEVPVTIQVEYLWEPIQCTHCLVFGHKRSTCTKLARIPEAKPNRTVVDDEGFTKVVHKKWRAKEQPKNQNIGGSSHILEENVETTTTPQPFGDSASVGDGSSCRLEENVDSGTTSEPGVGIDPSSADGVSNEGSIGGNNHNDGTPLEDSSKVTSEVHEPRVLIPPAKEGTAAVKLGKAASKPPSTPHPTPKMDRPPIRSILKNSNRFTALLNSVETEAVKNKRKENQIPLGVEAIGRPEPNDSCFPHD